MLRLIFLGLGFLLLLLLAKHIFELIFVLLSEYSSSLLSLGNKVVGSSDVVEFVFLYVGLTFFYVKAVVFLKQLHYFGVYLNLVPSYNDAWLLNWLDLIVPRVGSNVLD